MEQIINRVIKCINILLCLFVLLSGWLYSDFIRTEFIKIITNKTVNQSLEVVQYYKSIEIILTINILFMKIAAVGISWMIIRKQLIEEKKDENNHIDFML